ncbi:hypothetical protein A3SI_03523 [Nitritalea halalkaliphila LW7]|uniref:Uncharacterized protein n=1 Tax=Nitritalea halalkaliphila LW7 TaxID=1189621 RepID=I5C9C1_9BACT|nr:hypothetical protein [Nitritalea halalkaliphila]EIM78423.1 hypothetical protein A3SI_03523 [Nitritalea halalkaliphila LW7]
MSLLPRYDEVIVCSLESREILSRLEEVTEQVDYMDFRRPAVGSGQVHFNGTIEETGFRLSVRLRKADSFVPLIRGRLEECSRGAILFLSYRLFPGSRFFLNFWTVLTFVLFLFFGFVAKEWPYAYGALGLGVVNLGFAWLHFYRKVGESRRQMLALLGTGSSAS